MNISQKSNGTNQIIERKLDVLMNRTNKRPLPQGNMSVLEAVIVVVVSLGVGSWMLYELNLNSMILGLTA